MSLPINESTQPEVPQSESNPTLEPAQNTESAVDKPVESLPTNESSIEIANKPEIQNSNEETKVAEPVSQPKEEEKVAEAISETQNKEQEVKLPEAVSQPKEEEKATEAKPETQNNEQEVKLPEAVSEPKEEIKAVEPQAEEKPNLEPSNEEKLNDSTSQENAEAKEGEEVLESKPKRQYRKRGAKFDDFEKYNDTGSYIPATSRSGRAIKKATVFQAAEPTPTKRQRSTSTNTPADILIKKRGRKPKNAADSNKAQGSASKASGTKKKAGRPKKSDKAAAATTENDSKPEEVVTSQVESQSVPSATVGNPIIPAVLDNESIPQQDSSTSQFHPQLASNALPQPTPQTFENPALGINQNEPVSNIIPVQQQVPPNQFQQPHPIAPVVPTLSSNLPPANGYQPPVNTGIPPSFNPPAPTDQQIINNTVSKPGEIPTQFANPPPTQNQATFAAPTQFATDSAPTNTATYN
ncbi:hypothetical protein CONCODRAFT_83964 [Conidiobolus coronatus NRRL 28638]|uniref:Uncharacterized protein n=1 Tax=Conidiobolus coronatus (strain ATCC 28846 / CBS 209.66 / NRRL 28638) TaxID=796925 RepID=A0A137PBY3_CONC2|nr:hypothetical protein CONCODRAFT_83964 [Conidiobolus coronatus NRRL 28638]|eukprot:KXN72517.1 hypothetical protein CONCODRAFT_83964 [Conidiobolus coronatus NRRL 28638]